MRAGENVAHTYTYPEPLGPIVPVGPVYHPSRSMRYEAGGGVPDPYPDDDHTAYSPISLELDCDNRHLRIHDGYGVRRYPTESERVAAQV